MNFDLHAAVRERALMFVMEAQKQGVTHLSGVEDMLDTAKRIAEYLLPSEPDLSSMADAGTA